LLFADIMPSNEGQETERIYSYWAAQLKKWYDNVNANANPVEFCLTPEQAQQMGVSERMAKYWLVDWSDKGIIQHTSHGQYEKVA